MQEPQIIRPQEGYQLQALSSSADIVIGGAAAGVGKTYSLLLDPLRDIRDKDFNGVIFRRTTPQITNPGAIWDASYKIYPHVGGFANKTLLTWIFPSGSKLKFSHIEHEKNIYDWQGSEICFIGLDEVTQFTEKMFFYLLSRNRSTTGIRPYVRATCNPDPDSWVAEFISWWIGKDGYPIPERQGKLRYFARDGESMIWGDSEDEVLEKARYFLEPIYKKSGVNPKEFIKSVTFISGDIYDNKELIKKNPNYLANLAAQDEDTRKQLLEGNWKAAINPMDVLTYTTFKDIFTNDFVEEGQSRITVDAAMGGDDKLIICVFKGRRLVDLNIMEKSTGKDIIDKIKEFQRIYGISNSRVCYDADGVGAFIGGINSGFISNSVAFHNNSRPVDTSKETRKFKNLKAQCYYLLGDRIDDALYYIEPKVANMVYDDNMTVRQRLMHERKAIKKMARKDEEPYGLIKKDEMKQKYLSGDSPDLLDAVMMNEYFYLEERIKAPRATMPSRR